MLNGIDVSWYQGVVNFNAVADDSMTFATAQISFGTEAYMTSRELHRIQWADQMAPALYQSHIPLVGGYHWLLPGDIELQVDHFIKKMNMYFGGVYGRICQLDVEFNERLKVGPTHDEAFLFAKVFAEKTQGAQLSLYYPYWYWHRNGQGDLTAFPNCSLWQADYRDDPIPEKFISYGGLNTRIVQYSSQGVVSGVNTGCDMNAFLGDYQQLWDDLTGRGVRTACKS
jgi:GH25 family lysozyme M1 (1,4-beta-N-acetylmuramidase)